MTNVLDFILDLFRDPVQAEAFINDPGRSMASAGVQNVSAAQVNAVAASVAPAAVIQGGGNPVHGLQQAVAQTHGIAFVPEPQHAFAPQTQAFSNNDTLSHNAAFSNNDTLSHNDVLSPDQHSGANSQVGGFNLGFGDITLGGDHNEASDGSVINTGTAGDIDATNVKGDGNVVGDNNTANTGKIEDSNVNLGDNGKIDDRGDITAGGDVIKDNEGPVVNDVDMSGGGGGNASAGGGGLIGGGNAAGGTGGSGGGLVINDNDTTTVGGNQTNTKVGGDVSGSGGIRTDNSEDNDTTTTTTTTDNSGQDNSTTDNSGQVNTNVDVSNEVEANVGGGGGGGFDPIGAVGGVADDIFG
jgi:hypothetical protein